MISLPGLAWAADPVYIPDPNLKAVIEYELWISDPTPADMLGLTSLTVYPRGIRELTGLEYATNLVTLELTRNLVSDISVLSALSNLETLVLNNNQVSDMSVVAGLNRLEYLDIHDNQISDISAVSGLSTLHTVILRSNQISDVSPLSGLTNLQHLDLYWNQIVDVSPLSGLSNLNTLILERNEISDIPALLGLTSLEHLDLRRNPLNDDAYDVYIPQITADNPGIRFLYDSRFLGRIVISSGIGGRVTDPGEGEFFYGNLKSVLLRESEIRSCTGAS